MCNWWRCDGDGGGGGGRFQARDMGVTACWGGAVDLRAMRVSAVKRNIKYKSKYVSD